MSVRRKGRVGQYLVFLMTAALLVTTTSAKAQEPVSDLWTSGQGGYDTYRIPALIQTAEGTLACLLRRPHGGAQRHR
jgi:hypothetical protein